jgi:hypothetical protein
MRTLGAIETSCFHFVAANPRRFYGSLGDLKETLGDSRLFYPSGGHKPMVALTILIGRANVPRPFRAPPGHLNLQPYRRSP